MVTTRDKILSFLRHRGPASATELSRALKLTPANIRHHLRVLQKEGVVLPIHFERTGPKGRPACLYGLSEQQEAHNLDRLCAAFLELLRIRFSSGEKTAFLRSLAQQLVADQAILSQLHLTQRLILAIKALNQMSYQASWEAHREAPTIKFSHCPYLDLVEVFPELCQMDVYLLEALMKCPVELVATRQRSPSGAIVCRFRVRQSP